MANRGNGPGRTRRRRPRGTVLPHTLPAERTNTLPCAAAYTVHPKLFLGRGGGAAEERAGGGWLVAKHSNVFHFGGQGPAAIDRPSTTIHEPQQQPPLPQARLLPSGRGGAGLGGATAKEERVGVGMARAASCGGKVGPTHHCGRRAGEERHHGRFGGNVPLPLALRTLCSMPLQRNFRYQRPAGRGSVCRCDQPKLCCLRRLAMSAMVTIISL